VIRICGWCRLFLGVKLPFSTWAVTHGICGPCRDRLGDRVGTPPPRRTPRNLLILARHAPPLTAHLALPVPAYWEPTLVLWDRRATALHGLSGVTRPECQPQDRRAPGSGSVTGGYLLVRLVVRRPEWPSVIDHLTGDLARSS
jgi:hypothetical protein